MNGSKIFLDTNIVLYLLSGDITIADLLHEKHLYVSIITELELLGYKDLLPDEERIIKDFISQCKVINISNFVK